NVGLRAVEEKDLELLKNWRNLEHFRRNFREVRELNDVAQKAWFEKISKSQNDFMFSIVRLKDNAVIGACGLLYINWIDRTADFSFYIGEDELYIDEVYAPEATKLLLDYGFNQLNLNRIWMELYSYDHQKLSFFKEKFGFQEDGILRENHFCDGKYWNSYLISLLAGEFRTGTFHV